MSNIAIKNLSKSFSFPDSSSLTVLKDINLEIQSGDFLVILGESGCGKSTLLYLISGLLKPSSGSVWIDNHRVVGPFWRVSMLFQHPSLLPWLNVAENIGFGCKLRGEKYRLKYRVDQFIEMMGLSGFSKARPAELSGGMAQRVALARALIGQPDVLLLDEPFTALDTFTRIHLQEELINIWQSECFTSVFVTHNIDEAITLGKKIIILSKRAKSIDHVFEVELDYPRDISGKELFDLKLDIIKHFKKSLATKDNYL